jgi:hypothetical protein
LFKYPSELSAKPHRGEASGHLDPRIVQTNQFMQCQPLSPIFLEGDAATLSAGCAARVVWIVPALFHGMAACARVHCGVTFWCHPMAPQGPRWHRLAALHDRTVGTRSCPNTQSMSPYTHRIAYRVPPMIHMRQNSQDMYNQIHLVRAPLAASLSSVIRHYILCHDSVTFQCHPTRGLIS